MDTNSTDQYSKAKGYALRLFKLRPRSTAELAEKMRGKGYPPDIIERVTSDMKAWGYLDDGAFTKAWLQGRLKRYGFRRIARELADKGIPKDLVQSTWEELRTDVDEEAIVREIALRRVRVYKGLHPLKRKKRMMDYLARRGFSLGMIVKVVREL
jgi:regulatory protein